MSDWFTIDPIDQETYIISEYRHWEETHCYLLNGAERSLLIDTGLGICNIYNIFRRSYVVLKNAAETGVGLKKHGDF